MLARGLSRALPAIAVMSVLFVGGDAFAAGFAAARFGGERGNPTETNPTTIYYNPAGFGMSEGTNIYLDANTAFRSITYDRPSDVISDQNPFPDDADKNARALDANSGESTLSNIIVAPMLGLTTDFGLDLPVKLGLGVYAPFGGQSDWDKQGSSDEFPGAEDGSQRWYSIDGTIQTIALSGALAYHLESARVSFGLSGSLLLSKVDTLRARNSDGSDNLENSGVHAEGRTWLDVSSTDYNLGAGVLWEVWRRKAWLGLSYQAAPNFDGKMEMDGTLTSLLGTAKKQESDVIFTQALPDVLRFGLRVRPKAAYEIRVFGDWTRWSKFENQCLANSTVEDIYTACEVNEDGGFANPDADTGNVVQVFDRSYTDAWGVRLGGSYWLNKALELQVGAGYDSNAVPDKTIDAALLDMNKVTASLGGVYQFTDWMAFGMSGTNVFYFERDLTDATGNDSLELPSKQPGNQGIYTQNIFLINTNMQFTF